MEDVAPGGRVSYNDLDRVLGYEFRELGRSRSSWFVALRRYQDNHPTGTFVNVRNVGYERIDRWPEVRVAGEGQRKKAARSVNRGRRHVNQADRATMTDEERTEQTNMLKWMGMVEATLRSHTRDVLTLQKRTKRIETVKADREEVAQLRAELTELQSIVRRQGGPSLPRKGSGQGTA